jgi:tetratricopeptide (TPR) repeat protein
MPKSPLLRARFGSLSPVVRALFVATACGISFSALAASEHDEVDRLVQAGKFEEAQTRADAFLKDKPKDAQMRFLKGVIQLNAGKRNEAIAVFTQLTQDSPELPEPYNNLAVIYAGQNQFDKARAALESAIRTNPSYATAQENLGDVYARLASQAYSKALQLDQNNAAAVQPKLAVIRTLFTPPAGSGTTAVAAAAADSNARPAPAARVAAAAPAPAPAAPTPAPVAKAPAAPAPMAAAPVAPAPAPTRTTAIPAPAAQPAVIAKAPETTAVPASAAAPAAAPDASATADVENAVRTWAAAWAAQDMDRYLAAYGPDFNPGGGQSRKAWEEERHARIVGKSNISVNLENLVVHVDGQVATAKFRQIYRADNLNIRSRKTLELQRASGSQWQIRKESVGG